VRFFVIPRGDMEGLLDRNPAFARHLIRMLIGKVRTLTQKVLDLALKDVYGRFAKFIDENAVEQKGMRVVSERLTQHDIAARIGGSREMVNRIVRTSRRAATFRSTPSRLRFTRSSAALVRALGAPSNRRRLPECASGTKPLCRRRRGPSSGSLEWSPWAATSASPETRQGDHHDQPQKSLRRIRFFAITAIAICSVLVAAAAALLAPAAATPGVRPRAPRLSSRSATARLLPGRVCQSGQESRAMPEMYY